MLEKKEKKKKVYFSIYYLYNQKPKAVTYFLDLFYRFVFLIRLYVSG